MESSSDLRRLELELGAARAEAHAAREVLTSFADAAGAHFYVGEIDMTDGSYRELFTGPQQGRMLGEPVPQGDAGQVWDDAIHPDDRPEYDRFFEQLPDSGELTYRLVGYDGITRWVTDRVRVRMRGERHAVIAGLVLDVTSRLEAERGLAGALREREAILGALPDLFFRWDREGRYLDFYAHEDADLIVPPQYFLGRLVDEVLPLPAAHAIQRAILRALDTRRIARAQYELVMPEGSRWFEVRMAPLGDDEVAALVRDVTEREQAERSLAAALEEARSAREEAERLLRVDALTDIANRQAFNEALESELARAGRGDVGPGLLVIDIDRFKTINDTHGHRCGDEVLRELARRVSEQMRPYDTFARYGGDEFALVVSGGEDRELLLDVAERARAAVAEQPFLTSAGPLHVTISVGAAGAEVSSSADDLMDAADAALYTAKRRGRDRVRGAI